MPGLLSLLDLSTAEAHALAIHVSRTELPPLEACENEDWGRDLVLQVLFSLSDADLAKLGLRRDAP